MRPGVRAIRRPTPFLGVTAVLLGLLLGASPPAAHAAVRVGAAERPTAPDPAGEHQVTLITGDRVTVFADGGRAAIDRGLGREGLRFTTERVDGRLVVVPEDARGLIVAGRLDRRLFDVTTLIVAGYDDAHRADLPVRLSGGAVPPVLKATAGANWKKLAGALEADDGPTLSLDGVATPTPTPTTASAGAATTHTLTVRYLGRDGRATTNAESLVLGLDTTVREYLTNEAGVSTASLPQGRYTLVGDIVDAESNWHRLVQPTLTLDRDLTVTVDARVTQPVTTRVERGDARPALVDVGFDRRYGDGQVHSLSLLAGTFGTLFTAQLGPAVTAEEMTSGISSTWGVPGPDGDFRNTPYTYNLLDTQPGRFFTGFHRTVADRELAASTGRHHTQVTGRQGTKGWYGLAPGYAAVSGTLLPYDLPAQVTHLLDTRDTQWSGSFGEQIVQGGVPVYATAMGSDYRSFVAGKRYTERWNAAVFGPYLFRPDHAAVQGDRMWFGVPLYTDQDNHRAGSRSDRASISLFRNGRLIGESAGGQLNATVPPGPATFRVRNVSERHSMFRMSTRVDATWTFSAEAGSTDPVPLPLWVVRYFPRVDTVNQAGDAPIITVPISVESQPQAVVGRPKRLVVTFSGDGGASWHQALVVPGGARGYVAVIARPAGARSLSLRAQFTDTRGNTVDQTIDDALHFNG
ncbi:hypothetical protein BDK92_1157 [Micromonospora pisi]|uniref:Uncharacterized protein n=1 Tax=Micromonospora pisi TaxID=589240 RepID=A0A495JED2_9ACTN|nr:peptidase S8 [Micromonospora pisi]RKR86888.1 hypothetical protein BDK92_1157 [Micromonospora pisi]